jgi:hypothetical protein
LGRFRGYRRRTRILIGLGLLALAAYLCLSLRFVRAQGKSVIQECRLVQETPRVLAPGWHFSPLGLCRRSDYPSAPQELPFNLPEPGKTAPVSREGVASPMEFPPNQRCAFTGSRLERLLRIFSDPC